MKRSFLLLTITVLSLSLLSSCSEYRFYSDLEVSVQGFLTGNPRDGVLVQLFYTREDAQDLIYPASPVLTTNEFGEVYILDLEPGVQYFVRVDGLLQTVVRRSGRLRAGANKCTVRLL